MDKDQRAFPINQDIARLGTLDSQIKDRAQIITVTQLLGKF